MDLFLLRPHVWIHDTLGGTCLNVGCILSKAVLYNSHRDIYHQALHDIQKGVIDGPCCSYIYHLYSNLKNGPFHNPLQILKAKDSDVEGLTMRKQGRLHQRNYLLYVAKRHLGATRRGRRVHRVSENCQLD